jgi:tRNA(Ile)-lysidine synthase
VFYFEESKQIIYCKSMIEAFEHFIRLNKLFSKRQKVLLGVSGGVDSVVMCYLFKRSGYKFAIAHCDFSLRGEESDKDATFVKELAEELECPFYEKKINTNWHSKRRKQSIQIVARDLRYEWFEKLRLEEKYDRIATAHHLNDSIETMLYNLTKGCGIRGLHGILPKRNRIIRPLLFAYKNDILAFAKANGILYRNDSSNELVKYSRNKIRNKILPLLKEINPVADKTLAGNIERFQEVEAIYDWSVKYWKSRLFKSARGGYQVDTNKFDKVPSAKTILYEILKQFEFNGDQIGQMLNVQESGKQFYSSTYRLSVEREFWYITELEQPEYVEVIIDEFAEWVHLPDGGKIHFKILNSRNDIKFGNNIHEGFFDEKKLKFPIKLRKWQRGDTFKPFGMEGHTKKLSDFFMERKMSSFNKENTWLMESKDKIAWIVGLRSDNRFRLTTYSKRVITTKWYPPEEI